MGDPAHLHDRADAWYRMAAALERADHSLLTAGRVATQSWEGDAADRFDDRRRELLAATCDAAVCRDLGRALHDIADEIFTWRLQVLEFAEQIVHVDAAQAAAFFTAGASEAAAATVTAGLVGRSWLLAGSVAELAVSFATRVAVTAAIESGAPEGMVEVATLPPIPRVPAP